MTNHFHLLVESLQGELSETIRWIESCHALYFNRSRNLRGSLFGARFSSFPVTTVAYLLALIRYIDLNPVRAGLVEDPLAYPYGSARLHAASRLPAWVEGELIARILLPLLARGVGRAPAYTEALRLNVSQDPQARVIEARLAHPARTFDDLDELLNSDGSARREWLLRRAVEGSMRNPGMPMADALSIRSVIEARRCREPTLRLPRIGSALSLWNVIEAGLLRDLAGLGYTESHRTLGVSTSTVRRWCEAHQQELREDPIYAALAGDLARQALEATFGPAVQALADDILGQRLASGRSQIA